MRTVVIMTIGPIGDTLSTSSKHGELALSSVMTTRRWEDVAGEAAESESGKVISAWKVRDEPPPERDMPVTECGQGQIYFTLLFAL